MAYGFNGHVSIARETTFTNSIAPDTHIEALSESLTLNIERYETKNIYGGYHEANDSTGLNRVEGDLVFAAHPTVTGFFLAGVLGVSSTTEVGSGVLYSHTFTEQTADTGTNNPLPPFQFEVFRDVTSAHFYNGAQISKLSLNCQPNQALQCTATIMAQAHTVRAKSTATFPNTPTGPWAFDTCSISIGGSATALIESVTLDVDNQIQGIGALNASTKVARFRRGGPRTVRLNGNLAFSDITEYQNFVNQTEQRVVISFFEANSFSLSIDIPSFVYTAFPVNIGGRERLVVGFEGKAMYNAGSAAVIKATMTSVRSGYHA
jgi:hypothetical protein